MSKTKVSEREAFSFYNQAKEIRLVLDSCSPPLRQLLTETALMLSVKVEAVLSLALPTFSIAMCYSKAKFSNTYSANVVVWTILLMSVSGGKTQVTAFFQVFLFSSSVTHCDKMNTVDSVN